MKAGMGETRRTIPLHTIHRCNPELCRVLPAIHCLTGAYTTSKVGTKKSALKGRIELLKDFDCSEDFFKAEEYLVSVLSMSKSSKTFNEYRKSSTYTVKRLRLWQIYHQHR